MASDVTESAVFYKLWAWVDTHRKQIQWGGIAVVIVGLATGYFIWKHGQRQVIANEALSSAINQSFLTGQVPAPEAFLKVTAEFPGTSAGGRALLVAGARYFIDAKYPEAKAQFERYLREYAEGPFTDQARLGVAASLDAQGNSAAAITAYQQIAQQRSLDSAGAQAKLALGRLYEVQGNLPQARDYYLQIARPEFGPIGSEAESRLRELIIEHPNLLPENPAPTNAPALNLTQPD